MKFSSDKQAYFGFGAGLLLLAFAAAYAYWNLDQSARSAGWVEKAAISSEAVDEAHITLDEAKTGARMYLFESNTSALSPFLTANAAFKNNLAEIRNFTLDPLYNSQTDTLQALGDSVLAKLQYDVEHNQRGIPLQTLAGWDNKYIPLFQSISTLADRMDKRETNLYTLQKTTNEKQLSSMRVLGTSSCLAGIIIIIIALVMMNVNIRRRKKAQKELDYQKNLYDKFLRAQEDLNVGIAITEGDKVVFCNDALCNIIGYSKEELLNIPSFFSLIAQEDILRLRAVMDTPQTSSLINTFSAFRKNGSQIGIEYVSQIIVNTDPPQTFSLIRDVTEKKREDELLKTNEARLAEAQRIAHIGSWEYTITDTKNLDNIKVVECSDEMLRLFGIERGEGPILREDFVRPVHPDDRQKIDDSVLTYLQGGPRISMDYRILVRGAEERIVHTEANLIHDENTGAPLVMRGTSQDITDRVASETRLRTSESRLSEAQHIAHIGDWIIHLSDITVSESNIVELSDENCRMLGLYPSAAAFTRADFIRAVHPDDRQTVSDAVQRYIAGGPRYAMDFRLLLPGNLERIVHTEAYLVRDEKTGKPIALRGTMQDVTERSHMTAQLQQYASQMKNIMENVDAGLVTVDVTGKIASQWSNGWERIYGYSIEEFQNDPMLWKNAIHPDDLAIIEVSLNRLYAGETISEEYRIIRKDGGIRWLTSRMTPTKNSDGDVVRVDGIIVDVTEKKNYEKYIADSLREKEYLLKELHHRVKNNMQVISSMLALQSDYLHDPGDKELFINSQNRVKAMAIVHEMLYQSPDLSTINISDYIHSLVEHLASMYADFADNIVFNIQVENIMFDITVAKPCGLIINEFVSNAIKYAFPSNRNGAVSVILTSDGDEANQYTLTIHDDGVGLPPNFDWRNPSSLGLRLCVAFAQEMGGKLEYIPKNGTQWRITFRHHSKTPPQLGLS